MKYIYNNKKSYLLRFLLLGLTALLFANCTKSLVEVDNTPSTDFQFTLPKEVVTFVKGVPSVDSLIPQIAVPGKTVLGIDTAAYSYHWSGLVDGKSISDRSFLISEDFDHYTPGVFSCLLTMTEKATGISQSSSCDVFITTATREGWMLLGEKAGNAQLSVLSYTTKGYTKYIDIKEELGIDIPLKGKPVSISALGTELPRGNGLYQWLGVATDQEVKFIQTMDFKEEKKMSDFLTTTLKPSADKPISLEQSGLYNFIATKGTELYYFVTPNILSYGLVKFDLINKYKALKPDGVIFNAAPYHTLTGPGGGEEGNRLIYDRDKFCFVRAHLSLGGLPGINGLFPLALPFSLDGYHLRAIVSERIGEQDNIIALLYHPASKTTQLIEFKSNGIVMKTTAIEASHSMDMFASSNIIIDRYNGYIFYTKANALYSYDFNNRKTRELINYGSNSISYLKLENYIPLTSKMVGRADRYKQVLKNLVVCTYDPTQPDNTGTFRSYIIPPAQQNLIVELEETGLPKIVSATFASIP